MGNLGAFKKEGRLTSTIKAQLKQGKHYYFFSIFNAPLHLFKWFSSLEEGIKSKRKQNKEKSLKNQLNLSLQTKI